MELTSRILRGAAPLPARRIEAAVFEADRRVREMVARAEERARGIVEEAEEARARVLADARAAGLHEAQGRAAATLAAAAAERDRLLGGSEREVVDLALAIARKVLARELAVPGAVASLAATAVAEARARREVVLRIAPEDAPEVRAAGSPLATVLGTLQVREDPSLRRGEVVVETEAGRIDARVEAQLEVLARAIAEESS
jgi:flagellar biosynthesis/type III secretory pathway protein FliH